MDTFLSALWQALDFADVRTYLAISFLILPLLGTGLIINRKFAYGFTCYALGCLIGVII